ncbi:MAG: IPExxxVDY family protein [Bacteroidota bacterium]
MKKYILDIDNEEETFFYGILSAEKIARLAWLLNKAFDLDLQRENSIEWFNQSTNENFYFNKFVFNDELNHLKYTFFSNSDDGINLFSELRTIQYFILIEGGLTFFDKKNFSNKVKAIKEIQHISLIDQKRLKQKVNLIL